MLNRQKPAVSVDHLWYTSSQIMQSRKVFYLWPACELAATLQHRAREINYPAVSLLLTVCQVCLLMQKGHTKARLEPQAPPKAHIMLSKYCTWPCLKESCIYSGSMLIADSTYCRRRWGGEWHHFLWQLYESSQQGGGCRLGDTAKPYSLSTCLLRTTSQLAVFAFQVFGEFMKSVFYWALFIFSLFLSSCSSSGPWMEGLCTVSFGPAEDDDLWP